MFFFSSTFIIIFFGKGRVRINNTLKELGTNQKYIDTQENPCSEFMCLFNKQSLEGLLCHLNHLIAELCKRCITLSELFFFLTHCFQISFLCCFFLFIPFSAEFPLLTLVYPGYSQLDLGQL